MRTIEILYLNPKIDKKNRKTNDKIIEILINFEKILTTLVIS
jgi:hypothetical protein